MFDHFGPAEFNSINRKNHHCNFLLEGGSVPKK